MGVVYLAEHPDFGPAAIKFLHAARAGDETFRARFRREVAAANRVSSPRVARVLAADLDAETPWLATTFVDGPTLGEAVAEDGPMTGPRLVALGAALADALVAIHDGGVVHRDLKPSNILLTPETPVVIDFGIATAKEAPSLTHTGVQIGTPGWMSPEQVRGQRVGPPTDVWSWALVMAYAGTGRPAFGRGPVDALYYRVVHQEPEVGELPAPLDELVPAALAKGPDERPTVTELVEGLVGGRVHAGADRPTAATVVVLPTIVAEGWGPDALPRHVHVPTGETAGATVAVPTTGLSEAPAMPPPGGPPGTPTPGRARPRLPSFWYADAEHDTPASLAAGFQRTWDAAADRLFVHRNSVWLRDLQEFLRDHGLEEAAGIVAAGMGPVHGGGHEPVGATMARLLVAMDPFLEPRFGGVVVTPSGLAAAANTVVGGRGPSQRLGEVAEAQVLRQWRSLPGMEDAPAVGERWQASLREFDQLAGTVHYQVGLPAPQQRPEAIARLLLFALGGRHAKQQARRLRTAQRGAAAEVGWWRQLADQSRQSPAAAVLALLTAKPAEEQGEEVRRRAEEARQAAEADRARQATVPPGAGPYPGAGTGAQPRTGAYPPPPPPSRRRSRARPPTGARLQPVAKAHGFTRNRLWMAATVAVLGFHMWLFDHMFGPLAVYFTYYEEDGALSGLETVESTRGLVVVATVAAVVLNLAARAAHRGSPSGTVRAYALAAAVGDFLIAAALLLTVLLAGLVAQVAADAPFEGPFGENYVRPAWLALAFTHVPVAIVALVLGWRSPFRFLRAALGRPVGRPAPHRR